MKICLILQRRFAFLSHDLVILLNQKYGVENFCGYVFQRSSYDFLRSQREINYHSLVLDEDVHARYKTETIDLDYLERLKQELGIPNLWPYIAIDRILMSGQLLREYPYDSPRYTHEEMMKIFQVKAKTVIEFLDKERPDALIVPNIGTTAAFLLYRLAQKRGIKILYISVAPPIRDRFIMSETYAEFTGVEKTFHENRKNSQKNEFREEARKFLHEFRSDPRSYHKEAGPVRQPSGGLKRFNYLLPKNIFRSFSWFIHLIYEHFTTDYRYDYSYIHPWNYLGDRVKRKIRNMIGANDLYDTFDPHEDFAFFPLHYEPEISLLLLAPFATDQLYLVRQIAKSLPLHFKLYVKEHPVMVPYRPRSYYKKLKKIPNVKLISPALSGPHQSA
ncbi:hypothetical protein HYV22_02805 [Candidatus Gottesmanbacteria bacterium]|nr:hypothetical protein [Candidatus Gottesmanbacteria bacterium]